MGNSSPGSANSSLESASRKRTPGTCSAREGPPTAPRTSIGRPGTSSRPHMSIPGEPGLDGCSPLRRRERREGRSDAPRVFKPKPEGVGKHVMRSSIGSTGHGRRPTAGGDASLGGHGMRPLRELRELRELPEGGKEGLRRGSQARDDGRPRDPLCPAPDDRPPAGAGVPAQREGRRPRRSDRRPSLPGDLPAPIGQSGSLPIGECPKRRAAHGHADGESKALNRVRAGTEAVTSRSRATPSAPRGLSP